MLFWSVVPLEMVLYDAERPPIYEELMYQGVQVLAEKLSPTQSRIVRILSTEPNDFLREELQPGTVMTYQPIGD
ncbi:MAG: YlzJ-like protein [Firmicutes bacterium]|nr:YlzJ-like protein [Bacillota bacterium]